MKTLKSTFFILLGCCFLLFTNMKCKKDKNSLNTLPPITTEGKDTFGCMFGNELWLRAYTLTIGYPDLDAHFTEEGGLYIVCSRYRDGIPYEDDMRIRFTNSPMQEGTYILNASNTSIDIWVYQKDGTGKEYKFDNAGTLKLTRFDVVNKIVSGEFFSA
ncbi:hypothetical protein FW774_01560 (plasmid) [Pedobacter sp. BS3]|uniref:hypothetical protein n=1 Tax=Pedobacter sp. BS3 TaxID=2567937 RepID=UPI0011EF07B4|nr:hypothetical protein [Pedobacter sp. BS3]TZF85785.1 hypothetical protein FW774_01560 [Pedobacter sp. BS3]